MVGTIASEVRCRIAFHEVAITAEPHLLARRGTEEQPYLYRVHTPRVWHRATLISGTSDHSSPAASILPPLVAASPNHCPV